MIYCAECVREEIRTTDTVRKMIQLRIFREYQKPKLQYDFSVTREYTDDFLKNTFDNFHLHKSVIFFGKLKLVEKEKLKLINATVIILVRILFIISFLRREELSMTVF